MGFATVSEGGVWLHIPTDLPRPSVAPDRPEYVRQPEYERIKNGTITELSIRFTMDKIDQSLWSHDLVRDAAEMMIAARILRRTRSFQEVADSLFADANIKLRLWYQGVANVTEGGSGMDMIVIGEEGVDEAQSPWLPDPNDLVDGFRPLPVDRDDRDNNELPDYVT